MAQVAEYLIETADRCSRIVATGRRLADELESVANEKDCEECERIVAEGREVLADLANLSQSLMAKAVEIDAVRQKSNPGKFGP